MSKWMLRQAAVNVAQLAAEWGLNPVLAHVLAVRGFRQKYEVDSFLQAQNMPLPSPLGFADMPQALRLVCAAIEARQNIVIFGDYDADGILSTVILYKTLAALSANVSYYIPQRDSEGYGLNNEAILALKQRQVDMIIACDNGVSALEQVVYANSLGISIVILDHHDMPLTQDGEQILVSAAAVVDAKRQDCGYPFKLYCAAGLCYRFSEALFQQLELDWHALADELLPLAALATVCDLVDLVGENRALVKRGLPAIDSSLNPGLAALRVAAGVQGQESNVYTAGFRLGPCINASGRLAEATLAVELFLTDDNQRATELAAYLVSLNEKRKLLTEQGVQKAQAILEQQGLAEDKIILIYCPQLNESVSGIVAGKIKEKYHKPVIMVAGDKEIVRASARSIEAYNIYEGLSNCRDLFISFGGHPLAAGFSIALDNVPILRHRLNQQCLLTEEDMQPIKRIDKLLPLCEVNLKLARDLQLCEPFGKGNPAVFFADKAVRLLKISLIGQNKQVMRLVLQSSKSMPAIEAVCFDGKERLQELMYSTYGEDTWGNLLSGRPMDIVLDILYTININSYQGHQKAQVQIVDFRLATG